MTPQVTVDVKSAWASKINWAQAVGLLAIVLTAFGIDMPDDVKVAIVSIIGGALTVVTWVLKTWFTTTVTPASAKKA